LPGIAVKVTGLPRQNGFWKVDIVILTGNTGLTDTGYGILDAGLLVVQVLEDVIMQLTISLFKGAYVNRESFVPTTIPFTFH
jgi:hypothetical protein